MKNIFYVIAGSVVVSCGISYILYKFFGKNVPPSIIGMMLILIYVGVASLFDKDDE